MGLEVEADALAAHPWPAEPVRDDFTGLPLRSSWNFLRNPEAYWSLAERPGLAEAEGAQRLAWTTSARQPVFCAASNTMTAEWRRYLISVRRAMAKRPG